MAYINGKQVFSVVAEGMVNADEYFSANSNEPLKNSVISNGLANAFKKKVENEAAVIINDASPIPHIFSAGLASRNKFVANYSAKKETISGVEFNFKDDGTIVANGTATATIIIPIMSEQNIGYEFGNYYISGCPTGGGTSIYSISFSNNTGAAYTKLKYDTGAGIVINIEPSDPMVIMTLRISKGVKAENLIFKPQLVKGTSSNKFTKVITDFSNVKLTKHGKNCLAFPYMGGSKSEHNGITYTVKNDGSVSAVGVLTSSNSYYQLSNQNFGSEALDDAPISGNTFKVTDCSYNPDNKITCIYITGTVGDSIDKTFYPQVEIGNEATSFEPPKSPFNIVDDVYSGIINGSENTSILSDTDGVIITCEYNGDITTALNGILEENEKLKQAIITLGGNI